MSTLLVNYWHHKQPRINIVESLEEILSLNIFPERIRQIDHPRTTQHPNTRMMRVDNYVVFFYIENHTVIVTDVLYGASNLQIE